MSYAVKWREATVTHCPREVRGGRNAQASGEGHPPSSLKTKDRTILKDVFQLGQVLKCLSEGTGIEAVVVFFYVDNFHGVLVEKVKC